MYQAAALLAIVLLALLAGCATPPPADGVVVKSVMTCAVVATGTATFPDGRTFPSLRLACSEGIR